MSKDRTIYIAPDAPAKPATGAPCNGCGLCCLAEPCPVGILVSRRLHGSCKALLWSQDLLRYQCGMVSAPARFVPVTGPRMAAWVSRLARRMISADVGCDADLQAQPLADSEAEGADTRL